MRLYAGAFVDVSFDYFIAHHTPLADPLLGKEHSQKVYNTLWKYEEFLPDHFKNLLERMEKEDWLFNYRHEWGIQFSFQNVLNKSKYLDNELEVFPLFLKNKESLEKHFQDFYPKIHQHIKNFSANND